MENTNKLLIATKGICCRDVTVLENGYMTELTS
jgi:hypothetical protein